MINPVFDISGKTAIVTGGGTGIGKAIALELAKSGVDVAIVSRNVEHLEPVAKEIKALGRRALALSADVRNEEAIKDMAAKVMADFKHIDILVNNSGVSFEAGVENLSLNGWNSVIEIDLTGTYLVSRHVGKYMIERKSGVIINNASIAGRQGFPTQAHYGAAKAGIINFTSSLAAEWGKYNIRVNAVAPGPILTDAPIKLYHDHGITDLEQIIKMWGARCALERCGQPEEVAYATIFLASDAASFISGTTLYVDGCYGIEPIRGVGLDL
ncbi:SDR family NAD(P)-dependent oxidoreductase [Chloroflexota bacterium]